MANNLQPRSDALVTETACPARRSALQGLYSPGLQGAINSRPVVLGERRARQILQLQGPIDHLPLAEAVQRQVGVSLPQTPNAVAYGDTQTLLALGPDRWWVVAPDEAAPLGSALCSELGSQPCAITDLGHGWSVFGVEGEASRELLAKLCSLDLHPSRLPPGRCAQTELRGFPVVLHALEADRFELFVMRSYAASLWEWLVDAAAEFGCQIEAPAA